MEKGFKVFNPDWTCRGFQYEVGKEYIHEGEIGLCEAGFHYCKKASDCFNYYSFDSKNKVAEVEAFGEVLCKGNKSVTNKLRIVKEITWQELLTIINQGSDNTGLCNTGDWNTGNRNTGDRNTGNRNTGNWNTGDCNTGNRNTGNCNTGNWNTGDRNTGNWNTGNWNTGDWNSTNFSSGVFCNKEQTILLFNKPSNMTYRDWYNSEAKWLLNNIQTHFWVSSTDMTDQEKELHPEHETTGGFLKVIHIVEAAEKWWNELNDSEKEIIKSIPNFDAEIFYNITGVKV